MRELVIASNNKHKIKEIRSILGNAFDKIYSLGDLQINCDPEENGETFYDNALIKAEAIARCTDKTVLADDTGLCVHALGGQPGVHSARYAGNHDHKENRKKLLDELRGKPDRSAHFETVVVLRTPDGKIFRAEGRVDGRILEHEDGSNGFGYDTLFMCDELGKSFGSATDEEKNSVSHRARALKNLMENKEFKRLYF